MSSDGAKLVRAASKGDAAKVKRLLKAKVDVNHGDKGEEGSSGITALQEACMSGHVGVVRLLLKAKAAVGRGGVVALAGVHREEPQSRGAPAARSPSREEPQARRRSREACGRAGGQAHGCY